MLHKIYGDFFFFFNDTATTEIYTLSLHDALPISSSSGRPRPRLRSRRRSWATPRRAAPGDRKSTRLNSSHLVISYAVFCLKKKKNTNTNPSRNFEEYSCQLATQYVVLIGLPTIPS